VDIVGGPSAERLAADVDGQTQRHDSAGLVSMIVRRDPREPEPEPKARLVSVRGKFETVYDAPPPPPNGTGFVITLQAAPELDATNVIIGKVIDGFDVLNAISQLPTVKDNTSSPFFAVAKSIGDKRALVAEQAFRKPFKKVQFIKCGVVEKVRDVTRSDEEPQLSIN
jgi:peptidyl-prolyl cis-trans isomerase B (cyclophilin B)